MVFSSLHFIFGFLPLSLLLYYASPLKLRNAVLFCLSLVFYAWGEPVYILIMLLSTAVDYVHGLLVARSKARGRDNSARAAVASSVVFNLAILFFFKYWDFVAEIPASVGLTFMPVLGLGLPIGISFYTFQTMSYTIDVYRGDAEANKSVVSFGSFVTLFPQLIAGPIIKYREIGQQLKCRDHTPERFASGVGIFVAGLSKKLLLADTIGLLWERCAALPQESLTTLAAWLGLAAFSFQIYFDFSGYSDMAVGLGRMLGFEFPRNFNYPYVSRSVTEFWRRWHISLGSWFRDYLYIPLGGGRVSRPRLLRNLLAVWAATGLWHGASLNFLLWGLYYGVLIGLEKLVWGGRLEKLPAAAQHIRTLFFVALGWLLFAVEDAAQLGVWFRAVFGVGSAGFADRTALYYLASYLPALALSAVASTPLAARLWERFPGKRAALPALILAGLVLSAAYMVDESYSPFLYFRF